MFVHSVQNASTDIHGRTIYRGKSSISSGDATCARSRERELIKYRHVRVHHVDKDRDDDVLRDVLNQRNEGQGKTRRRRTNTGLMVAAL
jgi:hypothetical protein